MAVRLTLAEARILRAKFPALDELLAGVPPPDVSRAALVAVGQPVAVEVERGPGRWMVKVANWCPASDNVRAKGLRKWMRAKKHDRTVVRDWLVSYVGVPRATGKRRVRAWVAKRGPRPDGTNLLKSFCDALVNTGLLVDDSAEWLEIVTPAVSKGTVTATTVLIEDIAT